MSAILVSKALGLARVNEELHSCNWLQRAYSYTDFSSFIATKSSLTLKQLGLLRQCKCVLSSSRVLCVMWLFYILKFLLITKSVNCFITVCTISNIVTVCTFKSLVALK